MVGIKRFDRKFLVVHGTENGVLYYYRKVGIETCENKSNKVTGRLDHLYFVARC